MVAMQNIYQSIRNDSENAWACRQGWKPLYTAHPKAKIVIIGQAPGRIAQASGKPWDDPSGRNLRNWMGVSDDVFYDETQVSLLPMDFYFPGHGKSGDLPPRISQAQKWHPLILGQMPEIKLTLLLGGYSQGYYLKDGKKRTLTETVQNYAEYAPSIIPLVHPSPRNNIWQKKNPWFAEGLLPILKTNVANALKV